jgi:hypothetical protein
MLQVHSLLWHYLWIAPSALLFVLGFLIWKRGLFKRVPAFFAFAILSAISELAVYAADVLPSVSPRFFWKIVWASLVIEGVLKFVLIGEIFAHVFGSYASLARLGRLLIRTPGGVLVLVATAAAAYAPQGSRFGIISGAHLLEQTTYLIESGLLVFIFLMSFYFHLAWERRLFGITLGLSISSCVHLASWALIDNGGLPNSMRTILVFVNMATYHVCVLIWWYYLLVPPKVRNTRKDPPQDPPASPPVEDLEAWNQEMERLLHR